MEIMKEIIEFDPQSREQVLSMMEAFPEAMAWMFTEFTKMAKHFKITPFYNDPEGLYKIQLTEGFVIPES